MSGQGRVSHHPTVGRHPGPIAAPAPVVPSSIRVGPDIEEYCDLPSVEAVTVAGFVLVTEQRSTVCVQVNRESWEGKARKIR